MLEERWCRVGGFGEVGDDRRHGGPIRPVITAIAVFDGERGSVSILARSWMEIGVEVRQRRRFAAVVNRIQPDVLVPRLRIFDLVVLETEDVASDLEHPLDDPLEGEVGGHFIGVDAVFGLADLVRVVGGVPGR